MRGGAKAVDLVEPVKLRVLTLKDLDAITDIDESLLGSRRRDYWAVRLERADTSGVPSLAAEVSGRVIGFILGSSSGWEYGIPENIAWIDTLGVRKGIPEKRDCPASLSGNVLHVQRGRGRYHLRIC